MKILLAHSYDGPAIKDLLNRLFPDHQVELAPTFDEAAKLAQKMEPDLVISHLLFNEMIEEKDQNGEVVDKIEFFGKDVVDLLELVREKLPDARFWLYTGTELDQAKQECPDADAYFFTHDPDTEAHLERALRSLTNGQPPAGQTNQAD